MHGTLWGLILLNFPNKSVLMREKEKDWRCRKRGTGDVSPPERGMRVERAAAPVLFAHTVAILAKSL